MYKRDFKANDAQENVVNLTNDDGKVEYPKFRALTQNELSQYSVDIIRFI